VKTPTVNNHLFSLLSNYSSVVSYRQTPELIMINDIAGTKKWDGVYQMSSSGWLVGFEGGADGRSGLLVCGLG